MEVARAMYAINSWIVRTREIEGLRAGRRAHQALYQLAAERFGVA